ncbi:MAG: FHA domain-containing protein [Clostridium sp.]|nr:FHA domain-containing protein [Clostridium sp.]
MDNSTGVIVINDGIKVSEVVLSDIGRSDGKRRIITFGRNPDCDIVLNSSNVSRQHGCFYIENGMYYIEDNNSTNGLVFDNRKIGKKQLTSGNTIMIPQSNKANPSERGVSFTFMEKSILQNQPPQEKIIENVVVVEKIRKYIPKWATALMAVLSVLTVFFILFGTVFSKSRYTPKGSYLGYVYDNEGEKYKDVEYKITFDNGTYVMWYVWDNDKFDVCDIGIYEADKGVISFTSLSVSNYGNKIDKSDLSPNEKCLYDGHSKQIALGVAMFEQDDKKDKLSFSIDEDYIISLNNKLDAAVAKSINSVGMKYMEEYYYGESYVYLEKEELTNPSTKFEKSFVEEIGYEDDETLQYLIENEMIYIEVDLIDGDDAEIWFD